MAGRWINRTGLPYRENGRPHWAGQGTWDRETLGRGAPGDRNESYRPEFRAPWERRGLGPGGLALPPGRSEEGWEPYLGTRTSGGPAVSAPDWKDRDARRGGHRGHGPKNYVRSDARIREDASEALSEDAHVDASEIEVTVSGGVVRLSGQVYDRSAKRRAEHCIERIPGVRDVANDLRIRDLESVPPRSSPASSG